jgi:hypothetical protein
MLGRVFVKGLVGSFIVNDCLRITGMPASARLALPAGKEAQIASSAMAFLGVSVYWAAIVPPTE